MNLNYLFVITEATAFFQPAYFCRKSQTPEGLTEAERAEQAFLRQGYVDAVKANLRAQLDGIRRAEE